MARHAEVLLYLVKLRRFNRDKRVFLAIDSFGFQGGKDFTKGHRYGVGTQGFEGVEENIVLHHTHFDAIKIFSLGNRALAVGQVSETVFPIGQIHQTSFFKFFIEVRASRAVEHGIGFFFIRKQERQVKRTQLFHNANQGRRGRAHHLLRTCAQCLSSWQVTTRSTAPKGVDLHLAASFSGEHFLHLFNANANRMVFIYAVGELDGSVSKLSHR